MPVQIFATDISETAIEHARAGVYSPNAVDVVLAELGEFSRFSSEKEVVSYAGLAPGLRESAGKTRQLGITKQGSRLLRWAMIELAWRIVGKSRLWGQRFAKLQKRAGSKKAIVAIARRLLGAVFAILRTGKRPCQVASLDPAAQCARPDSVSPNEYNLTPVDSRGNLRAADV